MKVTIRSARMDKDARHNDRNFDLSNAKHIDKERLSLNKYYTYNGDEYSTFLELEKEFYRVHFSDYVNEQNERNTKSGHKKRNRTIEDYFHAHRTRPEDVLLQIGDENEHATGEELWNCALKYKDKFEEKFGDNCKILDMAMHMDEATPHVHIRRVWMAEDERGNEIVSERKALEKIDILAPDEKKQHSKYNNTKVTFSAIDREIFTSIAEDEGFVIDRVPGPKRKHLSVNDYKETKAVEELERSNKSIDRLMEMVLENEILAREYEARIRKKEKMRVSDKIDLASTIFEGLVEDNATDMKEFIFEKGLLDEYNSSKNKQKTTVKNTEKNYELEGFF